MYRALIIVVCSAFVTTHYLHGQTPYWCKDAGTLKLSISEHFPEGGGRSLQLHVRCTGYYDSGSIYLSSEVKRDNNEINIEIGDPVVPEVTTDDLVPLGTTISLGELDTGTYELTIKSCGDRDIGIIQVTEDAYTLELTKSKDCEVIGNTTPRTSGNLIWGTMFYFADTTRVILEEFRDTLIEMGADAKKKSDVWKFTEGGQMDKLEFEVPYIGELDDLEKLARELVEKYDPIFWEFTIAIYSAEKGCLYSNYGK